MSGSKRLNDCKILMTIGSCLPAAVVVLNSASISVLGDFRGQKSDWGVVECVTTHWGVVECATTHWGVVECATTHCKWCFVTFLSFVHVTSNSVKAATH